MPGAEILLWSVSSLRVKIPGDSRPMWRGISDADGRAEIAVQRTELLTLHVRAKGFIPRVVAGVVPTRREVRLELEEARATRLRLVDASGGAVADVGYVVSMRTGPTISRLDSGQAMGEIVVAHPVRPLPGSTLIVSLVAPGFRKTSWRLDLRDPVESGEVVMKESEVFTGTVQDRGGGRPIADARVSIGAGSWRMEARTDQAGRFRLRSASPSTKVYELLVIHPSFAPARHRVKEDESDSPQVIQLDPGTRFEFSFHDVESGDPVRVESVGVQGIADNNLGPQECEIVQDGSVASVALLPDRMYRGLVVANGYASADFALCRARPKKTPYRVELHRPRTWTGRVTGSEDGAILIGLWSNLQVVDPDTCSATLRKRKYALGAMRWASCVLGADGSFAIPGLSPGRYEILMRIPGSPDREQTVRLQVAEDSLVAHEKLAAD
ncbi:MAG: carboxypeptidase-like regulatory domain-containing protein [Planctomycetota bacterium]